MTQQQTMLHNTLLPEETLRLASSHEHQSMNAYRLLSLRFLPYSIALSRLFEILASESEQRIQALMQMARHLQAIGDLSAELPGSNSTHCQEKRHFFVIGDAMAAAILIQVLRYEDRSALFYQQLHRDNGLADLDTLLATFTEQKRTEYQVLQETQGHLLQDASLQSSLLQQSSLYEDSLNSGFMPGRQVA